MRVKPDAARRWSDICCWPTLQQTQERRAAHVVSGDGHHCGEGGDEVGPQGLSSRRSSRLERSWSRAMARSSAASSP